MHFSQRIHRGYRTLNARAVALQENTLQRTPLAHTLMNEIMAPLMLSSAPPPIPPAPPVSSSSSSSLASREMADFADAAATITAPDSSTRGALALIENHRGAGLPRRESEPPPSHLGPAAAWW